jgi:hypothetical protein
LSELMWWAYRHVDGSVPVKRYFGPRDVSEAQESEFCDEVVQPFTAANASEARAKALALVGRTVRERRAVAYLQDRVLAMDMMMVAGPSTHCVHAPEGCWVDVRAWVPDSATGGEA